MKIQDTQKPNITQAQFEAAMAAYAEAEQREAQIKLKINQDITILFQLFEDELQRLSMTKHRAFETAQAYCKQHKDSLFCQRRSIGTTYGIAGFRLGTPKLKTENGTNWDNVLTTLKEKLPRYVRTTEEPARNLLLADRYKENIAPMLVEMGVHVVQEEIFYIEPKIAA
jgi:phage host-nuclease inhibitor protein Gam